MKAESQEFNDNTGNTKTNLCFHCLNYKTIDEFQTQEGKKVCQECFKEYEKLCKDKGAIFVEEERNEEHYSHYYGKTIDHKDVYAIIENKKVFIKGYVPGESDEARERGEIFNIKSDFLKNGLKYIRFYCGANGDDGKEMSPIEFLKWIKENKYNFGVNYNCAIKYLENCNLYNFHGNLEEISCAFRFRIYDKTYLKEFIELLKDPYFKNIKILEKEE